MLDVHNVHRNFGALQVLRGVDISVANNEIFCLLGPSGCGKTTLLRIIAGLEQADLGSLSFDGRDLARLPAHQRGFGLMFQDFALFPHMTVAQNVSFGLRMQNLSIEIQHQKVKDMLSVVDLSGYGERDVVSLSGGERQRVALARSLAPNPKLLMLDEPLGSLDAVLREELVLELRRIIENLGLSAIYVTHDQHEAFAIADRIAIMNRGVLEQVDTPHSLYHHPKSEFVARFLGLNNILSVSGYQNSQAQTTLGMFPVSFNPYKLLLHTDYLFFAPDKVTNYVATIEASVSRLIFQGGNYRIVLSIESGVQLTANFPSGSNLVPRIGDTVMVYIDPRAIIPLEK